MANQPPPRPSRWGASVQQPPISVDGGAPVGGGGGPTGGEPRERSQWNDPRRRGYDTTDAPAGGRFGRDEFGRDARGRWGDNDRRESGGGRPSYDNQRHDERYYDERDQGRREEKWRCMECGVSNHPVAERCPRCRTWRGDGPPRDRRDRNDQGREEVDGHYGPPGSGRRGDRDEEGDFGRRPRKPRNGPRERQWPPQFEASGSSFIFDARSGMFYEPASDFFYDPKTKLYYGNKKQQYFRYVEEKKPYVFQPVGESGAAGQPGQAGGMATAQVVTAAEEAAAETTPGTKVTEAKAEMVEQKPKIAISLKTALPQKNAGTKSLNELAAIEKAKLEKAKLKEKKMKRKESAMSAGEGNATPGTHKKHAKDLDTWSERVKEMRDENPEAQPAPKKVKTTASGQPICILCRRKFANLEKLAQHERLSALHKENLAKKAAADAAAKEAALKRQKSDTLYRDRSKERRTMYGSHTNQEASSHAEALLAHSLGSGSDAKPAEVVRPEETLNDTNVGNKLLQKMGWKSGEKLGREVAPGKDGAEAKKDSVASSLQSDWERIESLAQRGGRR